MDTFWTIFVLLLVFNAGFIFGVLYTCMARGTPDA